MEVSPIVNSPEEYDRFVQEVVIPRYEAVKADPSNVITIEDLFLALEEWDCEDGLLPERDSATLKRSA